MEKFNLLACLLVIGVIEPLLSQNVVTELNESISSGFAPSVSSGILPILINKTDDAFFPFDSCEASIKALIKDKKLYTLHLEKQNEGKATIYLLTFTTLL